MTGRASTAPLSASAVLGRVEKELREIWAPAAGEAPKSRACTMNLVVVASTPELARTFVPAVEEVTQAIPARAIVVALEPDAAVESLEADVSAVCGVEGEQNVCSERVRLTARGAVCARVSSVTDALCVPDLPTAVVWLGRVHVDDPVFQGIADEAQRIVLDTEYTSLGSLLHVVRWASAAPGRAHVADLAWTRVAVWQEMTARFFDDAALRDHAFHVTKLRLEQASPRGAAMGSEAALMLGWIATRLGWRVARIGGSLRFRRPDGQNVSVELVSAERRDGTIAPGELAALSLVSDRGGVTSTGSLTRDFGGEADVLVWRLDAPVPRAAEQRVRLRANRGASLLERTLHRPARDDALVESVAFAGEVGDGFVCA